MNALLQTAKRLEDGDFSARTGIVYGPDKFGKLARAFDRMAELLEHHTAERQRAEEERRSRETAERLAGDTAIMADIGQLISSSLDIDEVYERFAIEAKKIIPFDRLAVNLHDLYKETVKVAYTYGEEIDTRRKGDLFPLKGSISEYISKTKTSIYSNPKNFEEIEQSFPHHLVTIKAGMHSLISVPLIYRDEVIGSLHFRSIEPDVYTEQDLRRAERIGAQIAGAIGSAQLFSDLKTTENSLRESERRFRDLVEQAAVGVAEIDINTGRFLTVNQRLCKMVGRAEEELLETTFQAITHPEDIHLHKEYTRQMLDGKITHYSLRKRYLRKDGETVWVYITVSPLWKPGETPGRNIVVVWDITDHKRAEEEKRNLEERLHRAEKMEALGLLAGGVAHDLNNILGVSMGYAEILQKKVPEESPLRTYADKILSSNEKGAAVISDLLTLARRSVSVARVIDFNSVVTIVFRSPEFENLRSYHPSVTFNMELEKELLNINGSPVHLEKTVFNLIANAAEAISGRGEVTIHTENRYLDKPVHGYEEVMEGDYAVMTISDNGGGIRSGDLNKIFEPFYTKKTMGRSGTGLGLSIVWGTVRDHNGYIDVHSIEGKGTTFTIYFPAVREKVVEGTTKISIEQYMGHGESVLVIDDVAEQRQVATDMLRNLGYQVNAVSSSEEAVEYLKNNKTDILVLDMIMEPGIDGLETYKQILNVNPKQKAIIVSGFSETGRVKEAQKLGAGAYIKKPYIMEKIGMAIRDELNKNR